MISAAADRLQYQQKVQRATAQNPGVVLPRPGFALAILDQNADGSAVSSASERLRQAIAAIEHSADLKGRTAYDTIMPSAALLHDAPVEAAALVAAAHAASISVLTWTVCHRPFQRCLVVGTG